MRTGSPTTAFPARVKRRRAALTFAGNIAINSNTRQLPANRAVAGTNNPFAGKALPHDSKTCRGHANVPCRGMVVMYIAEVRKEINHEDRRFDWLLADRADHNSADARLRPRCSFRSSTCAGRKTFPAGVGAARTITGEPFPARTCVRWFFCFVLT